MSRKVYECYRLCILFTFRVYMFSDLAYLIHVSWFALFRIAAPFHMGRSRSPRRDRRDRSEERKRKDKKRKRRDGSSDTSESHKLGSILRERTRRSRSISRERDGHRERDRERDRERRRQVFYIFLLFFKEVSFFEIHIT